MSAVTKLPLLGLDGIELKKGNHYERGQGVCVMEAVAWVAGEPHSDHPQCACPVITSFMIKWNDRLLSDAERNRLLKPLVPLLVGTRSTREIEQRRLEMIRDFVARDAAPAALSLAGLDAAAEMLRANPTFENVRKARDLAWKARAASMERARKKFVDAGVDAVVVAGVDEVVDAVVEWNKLDYLGRRAKAREIIEKSAAAEILLKKFAPIKAALQLGAQDLVRKMCTLKAEEAA